MGVKLDIDEVVTQLISMNSGLLNVKEKVESLVSEFDTFCMDEDLQSSAYKNHKSYISSVQLPTASGIASFCDAMIEANNSYSSAITDNFTGVDVIDEDRWRREYDALLESYNMTLNIKVGIVYIGMSSTDAARERLLASMQENLEWYRKNIENIGTMLTEVNGIYADAGALQSVLSTAINQLGNITIGADGIYNITGLSFKAFEDITKQELLLQIAEEIRKEVGEILTTEELAELSQQEQLEYINKLADIMSKYYPTLSYTFKDMGEDGRVEIPIAPGLVIYLTGAVSSKTAGTGEALSYDAEIARNREILSSWSASIDNVEYTVYENKAGEVTYYYKIDSKSKGYIEVGYDAYSGGISAEYGAITEKTTEKGSIEVTLGCGIEAKPQDAYMEEVNLEDYNVSEYEVYEGIGAMINDSLPIGGIEFGAAVQWAY